LLQVLQHNLGKNHLRVWKKENDLRASQDDTKAMEQRLRDE
jgi:hypothetical protein